MIERYSGLFQFWSQVEDAVKDSRLHVDHLLIVLVPDYSHRLLDLLDFSLDDGYIVRALVAKACAEVAAVLFHECLDLLFDLFGRVL